MIRLNHPTANDGYDEIRATVDRMFAESPDGIGVAELEELGLLELLHDAETRRAALRAVFEGQGAALAVAGTTEALVLEGLPGLDGVPPAASTAVLFDALPDAYLAVQVQGHMPTHYLLESREEAGSVRVLDAVTAAARVVRTVSESVEVVAVSAELDGKATPIAGAQPHLLSVRSSLAVALQVAGMCDHLLELGRDHVQTRHQFGRPIGSFQAVQHLLADTAVTIAAAHATNDNALVALEDPDEAPLAALVSAGAAVRAFDATSRATQQVLGAIGYTREHEFHKYLHRGLLLMRLLGSTTIDRRLAVVARAHGATAPARSWFDDFEEGH